MSVYVDLKNNPLFLYKNKYASDKIEMFSQIEILSDLDSTIRKGDYFDRIFFDNGIVAFERYLDSKSFKKITIKLPLSLILLRE